MGLARPLPALMFASLVLAGCIGGMAPDEGANVPGGPASTEGPAPSDYLPGLDAPWSPRSGGQGDAAEAFACRLLLPTEGLVVDRNATIAIQYWATSTSLLASVRVRLSEDLQVVSGETMVDGPFEELPFISLRVVPRVEGPVRLFGEYHSTSAADDHYERCGEFVPVVGTLDELGWGSERQQATQCRALPAPAIYSLDERADLTVQFRDDFIRQVGAIQVKLSPGLRFIGGELEREGPFTSPTNLSFSVSSDSAGYRSFHATVTYDPEYANQTRSCRWFGYEFV